MGNSLVNFLIPCILIYALQKLKKDAKQLEVADDVAKIRRQVWCLIVFSLLYAQDMKYILDIHDYKNL